MTPEEQAAFIMSKSWDRDPRIESLIATAIRVAAVNAQRWIPVTERLPEDEVAVLIYPGSHKAWRGEGDWWMRNFRVVQNVTHWQPLPPPPEEQ